MSYSRWMGSVWYTYWCAGDHEDIRDEQLFDICTVKCFKYKDLKADSPDFNETIRDIKAIDSSNYTEVEYEELKGYIIAFIADVEDEYNTPSQLYRDGDITLEDAFVGEL